VGRTDEYKDHVERKKEDERMRDGDRKKDESEMAQLINIEMNRVTRKDEKADRKRRLGNEPRKEY
jgi:hypothetical protein